MFTKYLANKVKGLRLSFDRLAKTVKETVEDSSNDIEQPSNVADLLGGVGDMTLEQAAESIGIDAEQLNNPIIRPIAEKLFAQIKAKAGNEKKEGTLIR